jgi:hydroxyacylglutathione hydrolase
MTNQPPDWFHFWQRPYPSANTLLIEDEKPVLIDSGYGRDVPTLLRWLQRGPVAPEQFWLLINTHYHSDHVGGNAYLQSHFQIQIAAHRWEGQLINNHDPEAWSTRFLRQHVDPYHVDRLLEDGDELVTGKHMLRVMHTPGHTLGHISFYLPEDKLLICGDAVHNDDVAWINPFREGTGALQRAMESLERLSQLDIRLAVSGHGAVITQPQEAFERALKRYEQWLHDPEKVGWHACKRIFAYALMLQNGMPRDKVSDYLLSSPWYSDYCRFVFHTELEPFIPVLLKEMLRSGAAKWQDELLVATTPYSISPD